MAEKLKMELIQTTPIITDNTHTSVDSTSYVQDGTTDKNDETSDLDSIEDEVSFFITFYF